MNGPKTKERFSGRPWARLPRGTADDVVRAAHAAFTSGPWSTMIASDRGRLTHKVADLIDQNAQRLAEREVRDNGKLMAEMLGQMRYVPRWLHYYGGLADKIEGAVTLIDKGD